MRENGQAQPERIVELVHKDPEITTRIKRRSNTTKKPPEQTPASPAHSWMIEAEEQGKKAARLEQLVDLLRRERDTAWKEIDNHTKKAGEQRRQIEILKRELGEVKKAKESVTGFADRRIKELEEQLAAARWSADQYRRDNEFKANLLNPYTCKGVDHLAPLREALNTGGVVANHVGPNVTGHQRADPQKELIQYLIKALAAATR